MPAGHKYSRAARTPTGFTLIELMIVLAVFAILAAIAYPAYISQVIKARRADGHALLFETAMRQQQFFTANNAFTATIGDGGLGMSSASDNGFYTLSVTAAATTYTLTATRVAPQTADTKCGNLTLTHLGETSHTGTESPDKCW